MNAEDAAPARKDSSRCGLQHHQQTAHRQVSAIIETMPDMCEVYCCTARKPPALTAPATKVSL